LGEFIAPFTEQYAESFRAKALKQNVATVSQQSFWLKDGNTIINATVATFCFNALALNDSAYCSVNGAINSPNKITIKINTYG
jgi:hypothetical protein